MAGEFRVFVQQGSAKLFQERDTIMNITLKRAPGSREPSDDRLLFSERVGQRPCAEIHILGGGEPLRRFLLERLEVRPADASRIVTEQDAFGTSHLELPLLEPGELKLIARQVAQEQQVS
jgi:hypothetical protein